MPCSKCGNMLSPTSTYCTVCGASTAVSAASAGAQSQTQPAGDLSGQQGNAAYSPPRRAQTAFYGRYGMRGSFAAAPAPSTLAPPATLPHTSVSQATGAASIPTQQAPVELTSGPASFNVSSAPTLAGPAGAPVMPGSIAAPGAKPKSGAPLTPTPQRPLAGRLIALGSIALIVALITSLGILGYRDYKNGQTTGRATATAEARAEATSMAAARATATAGALLFLDPLASNTNSWMDDGTTSFFKDGQYHLHNPDPTMTLNAYYEQQTFDNFKISVTVTAYSDANPNASVPYASGLILRADPTTPGNKYVFFVSPNGTYNFARHDVDGYYNNGWNRQENCYRIVVLPEQKDDQSAGFGRLLVQGTAARGAS